MYAGEGTSLIRYEDESYEAASPRDQILVALAGGVVEEIVFGERRPGSCDADKEKAEGILGQLAATEGVSLDTLRGECQDRVSKLLREPRVRSAIERVAADLQLFSLNSEMLHEAAGSILHD